ncbi:flotillin family protein [Rhodoligotrophos defluvii]|uniref:flotillin family protein n=1 Tax=Rhodoligotrophos defluvii TaxID=2561934 RepID=UPI0010C93F27|nr:flotillin family protein [Rhodoligotrophos defluvii]
MTGADVIAIVILITILIAIGVYLLHWLYRHSSKDQSFVRTGLGGERVVMGGGALIIPIVHDITRVNMNAIPVEIRRLGEQSLITKNKMRIDLIAEFFVRVIPTEEGVSIAARTLGERTRDGAELKEIVQGRFVDALSAVAATMTMEEIHANRGRFMSEVSAIAAKTLGTNGLELENAALTSLNQTDISVFNPANAFDAEGLTQLTEQIEERRRLRNRIENEARIDIKLKDYETEQRALEIDRDLEYARIEQARAIEIRRAAEQAAIEEERSNAAISIETAKVKTEQEAERIRIARDRLVEAERIRTANEIRALEIERQKETELTEINSRKALETERILSRQAIEAERIENERKIKEFEIRSRQDISIIETTAAAEVDQARLSREKEVESSRIETTKLIEILSVQRDKEIRITNELADAEQEKARILRRYNVDLERLTKDEEIVQLEIAKNQKIKLAETSAFRAIEDASITANREIDELRIAARKFVDRFEIEQQKEVEIVDKERLIAVINKSIEEAYARTEAAEAWKAQAAVEEQITSAKQEEVANRLKRIELIEASAKTEREAQRLVTLAKAEREATEMRAQADIAEANAAEVRYAKEAQGQRLLNESENLRSDASRRSAIYENLVRNLPSIIRETVKPMERIDSIKILQVDGLPGLNSPSETGGGNGSGNGGGDGGSMTDRVVNSAMKYRTQVAFVDGLLKDLGLPVESIGSAGGMSFRNFQVPDKSAKDGDD